MMVTGQTIFSQKLLQVLGQADKFHICHQENKYILRSEVIEWLTCTSEPDQESLALLFSHGIFVQIE